MVMADKFGRTWKGRDIVWLRSANCGRQALYRWVGKDTERKLIYDKQNGWCDNNGNDIRKLIVDIVPALKKDENGNWEHFPNTDEAQSFKNTLTYDKYDENNIAEDMNEYDNEYDNEFNEEILDDVIIIK